MLRTLLSRLGLLGSPETPLGCLSNDDIDAL
jgi:hypothetical protein